MLFFKIPDDKNTGKQNLKGIPVTQSLPCEFNPCMATLYLNWRISIRTKTIQILNLQYSTHQ